MEQTIDSLVTIENEADHLTYQLAGLKNFLCDMEDSMKAGSGNFRLTLLISCVQHIIDDLEEKCTSALSRVIADMKGGVS